MRIKLLMLLILLSGIVDAQRLNKFGHLINDSNKLTSDETNANQIPSLPVNFRSFENSIIRISNGFIVLDADCESSPGTLHIFNNAGKEIFSETFLHTINFSLSPDKSFCIFNDLLKIHVIDLKKLESKTIEGSNIFAVNDNGDVIFYNEGKSTINFNKQSFPVSERIYRVCFYKNLPLFITKQCVMAMNGGNFKTVFCTGEGRIFDIGEFNNELFICVKTEKPGEFVFNSYSSYDLLNFIPEDEVHFPLMSSLQKNNDHSSSQLTNSSGELIRDPLNFYSDTVYQPIGNSYDEMQDYGSPPYLHPGVDLLGNFHQDVHSVKKGYVKAIITTASTAHWRIAISNQNTSGQSVGYLYAHIDSTTFPYLVGDSVNEGDVIGQLVNFGVSGFNHCHFARITDTGATWYGAWWTFDNPLSYMTNFFDTVPPVFEKTINNDEFAFRDVNGNYLYPDSLYGSVKVISKFYDLINSSWHVDVNKIRYNLSPLAFPNVNLLDTFSYEFNFYNDEYPGTSYYMEVLNTIYSRDPTCYSVGNYNIRDFYHIVTNSDGNDTIDGTDSLRVFNTMNYQDGAYIFRIIASDASGNTTADTMIIGIYNNLTGINNFNGSNKIEVFPNPSSDGKFLINAKGFENNSRYEIYNELGEKTNTGLIPENSSNIKIEITGNGIYFLRMYNPDKFIIKKLVKI